MINTHETFFSFSFCVFFCVVKFCVVLPNNTQPIVIFGGYFCCLRFPNPEKNATWFCNLAVLPWKTCIITCCVYVHEIPYLLLTFISYPTTTPLDDGFCNAATLIIIDVCKRSFYIKVHLFLFVIWLIKNNYHKSWKRNH